MASRYTPRQDEVVRRSGNLLRFTTVGELQAAAVRRATTLAPVAGLQLHVDVQLPEVGSTREALTGLRQVGRNFAARLVEDARKISRPTYDTGLFMSNWKGTAEVDDRGRLTVRLSNPTPYAMFVHRSGERGRTVVRTYIRPAVQARRKELIEDVAALLRRLVQRGRSRGAR